MKKSLQKFDTNYFAIYYKKKDNEVIIVITLYKLFYNLL